MTTEKKKNWYFSFGCGQKHAGMYVVLYGTCDETRDVMFEKFGRKWSMQYKEEAGKDAAEKWGWNELRVSGINKERGNED